jgi:hypothetical protein
MTPPLQILLSYPTTLAFEQLPAASTDADTSQMPLMTGRFPKPFVVVGVAMRIDRIPHPHRQLSRQLKHGGY